MADQEYIDNLIKNIQVEKDVLDKFNVDDIIKEYTEKPVNIEKKNSIRNSAFEIPKGADSKSKQDFSNLDVDNIIDSLGHKFTNQEVMDTDIEEITNQIIEGNIYSTLNNSKSRKSSNAEDILLNKNPIEFVDYMERKYIKSTLESNEKVFQLKNYKEHATKIKYVVLDFIKRSTLSQRLSRNSTLTTSIAALDDLIFAGDNMGTIRMYSNEKEYEYKSYFTKELESVEKRMVVSMDVSPDGEFLVAGYANGYLALWDLHTTKCKKLITNVHKSCIIAVKFIRNDKKKFDFISSDVDGNVVRINVKESFFSVGHDHQFLLKNESAIFLINIQKFSQDEQKKFPELSRNLIVAFGSLEFILVLMLEPTLKKLFRFERPNYLRDIYVPDISFGVGYVPNVEDQQFNESILDVTGNASFLAHAKSLDTSRSQLLLSISWGKIIYLYCMPLSMSLQGFTIVGHYINSSPILRMGFISNSIIFFFDKNKLVKVINTSLVTPGEVRLSTEYGYPTPVLDKNRKPELEEGCMVDPDVLFQYYVYDKIENTYKATYNNHILTFNKNLFIIAKNNFYNGKLLNWEQCLNNLNLKSEWMDALTLGLDIYHGRTTALADIPIEDHVRKLKVGHYLRNLIHHYAIVHTGHDKINVLASDKTFQERLIKCINICIEFCIEIEAIDFLLNNLQPIFDTKGYGDEFISKLEPFILCGKVQFQDLQQMTISNIIHLYIKNKNFTVLSQILIHLDIKSIDIDYVKGVCNQYNLITPIIYLFTNGQETDFFYPITKIIEVFDKAKEIPNFSNYQDCLQNLRVQDIESSKQYLGHYLFWYINICLLGEKFPSGRIPSSHFTPLIVRTVNFLFENETLNKLLTFDSTTFFTTIYSLFAKNELIHILKSQKFSINNENVQEAFSISDAIDILSNKVNELDTNIIKQDFYEFVVKISLIHLLEKSIIMTAAKYLLANSHKYDKITKSNQQLYNKYMDNISEILIEMIDHYDKMDVMEKTDKHELLSEVEISSFDIVKIHLLKMVKDYKRCLDILLQKDVYIKNKETFIFNWIDETLIELQSPDEEDNFNILKEEVLQKLPILADMSIENVSKLVENWFGDDQNIVIHKLDKAEHLQLKYVENVIDKFKDDIEFSVDNERKYEQYIQLLTLHIKLLCKLKRDQVLPNLKKRQAYPVDECLKKCLKYKVYDAAIYLMQSTGAIRDALNLSNDLLKTTFDNLINNILSKPFNENYHSLLIEDLNKNLKQSIEICENNSNKVGTGEEQEMWFCILEQIYTMNETLKQKAKEISEKIYEEVSHNISDKIKELLEKMCSYVSIQAIITNVTEKYKQAEFKEFKKLLLEMLSSYNHQKNILISAKNLLSNSIIYSVLELKRYNQRGNKFNLYKCDLCSKLFNHLSDEPIETFGCGHKYHMKCALSSENELICNICRKNEIENNSNANTKSLIEKENRSEIANENRDTINENTKNSRKDQLLSKLKAFDKHYVEKTSLMDYAELN